MPIKRRDELRIGWGSGVLKQGGQRNHDAVDAVATLRSLFVDEALLNRVRLLGGTEAFNRRDVFALNRFKGDVATLHGLPVQQDGTTAACARTTTKARAFKFKIVTQHIKQWAGRVNLELGQLSVNGEFDRHKVGQPPTCSFWLSVALAFGKIK